jgi:transcriptional regulator with XRE-family HTH domain
MHDLGIYLRSLREGHPGLTQGRAAAMVNVDRRTVERWEAGKNEPPLTRLQSYVEALGGSVDYAIELLLGRKQQPAGESPAVVVARARFASLPPDVIAALEPAADLLMRGRGGSTPP